MSVRDFVHLHTHSHYSLLEALPKSEELVAAALEDGQTALALTDNGNMYGAIDFYKEATAKGLKPILGVDFFVAPRTRHLKEHKTDDNAGRLVLLAKDDEGYRNLLKLVSISYLEGFHLRPRIDRELIETYRQGLLAILPAHGGEHAYALRHNMADSASQTLEWYKRLFKDDCYVEISRHAEIPDHNERMNAIMEAAKRHSIPIVATQEVYYMHEDDALATDLVNKIRSGGVLDRAQDQYEPRNFAFATKARMNELFADLPHALDATIEIANTCNLTLTLGKAIFPTYPIPKGSTDDEELRSLTESGIARRGLKETPALRERIDYELEIIKKKGYASYFLIVSDLLRHARDVGIFTNTRGSAAGSLVSYLCDITTVDPVAFNMPFERFLNPERPSAPDIDMDIADNRRDELIEYARGKYGSDHVVQIGTFGTMMARAAVRDVARALGHSYGMGDTIAKLIPFGKQGFPVTIKGALEETPDLKELYDRDPDAHEILDLAQKIEGNARHVGVHAAGVILAPKPVTEYAPIQFDPKGGKTITQYDMYSIADEYGGVGLLKFDFLGLTNLSVLADSVQRVKDRLGTEVDLYNVPLDDKKVYEMLTRGETLGVFQMAGSGMTAYLKDLKPTVIHDLNAMVALYRPGPMAFIPEYIERKRDPSKVTYLDPRMESILKPTYGVLIYQDDVMMMAVQLAGYSWGEADKFRKAMGKKIPEEMAKQKERFLTGTVEHGMKPKAAQALWEQIETFAAYGFNKAHAASYGNLAYKTAYMKANFPVDYMAAVLTADSGDVEKIAEIIAECKRMNIEVRPPSVNESRGTFAVVNDPDRKPEDIRAISFGLYSIKNFGEGVADSIIAEREKNGPFTDISSFLSRIPDKNLNKKSLEALIMSGALDEFGERGQLLANIERLLEFHRELTKAPVDQGSLFGASTATNSAPKLKLEPAAPAPQDTRLAWEKELLGLYVSGHPLDKFREKFTDVRKTIKYAKEQLRNVDTRIAGYLENVQPHLTKKGEKMAFLKISDFSGSVEAVVFPSTFKDHEKHIVPGNCIVLGGKVTERNGQESFLAEKVWQLS